jgi:hypothetical protein
MEVRRQLVEKGTAIFSNREFQLGIPRELYLCNL